MDSHDANNVTDKARMESEPNFLFHSGKNQQFCMTLTVRWFMHTSIRCFPLVLFDDVHPPPLALLPKRFLSPASF
jgi:hypothetical protein